MNRKVKNVITAVLIAAVAVAAVILLFGRRTLTRSASSGAEEGANACTIAITCGTILDNMDILDKEKHELIPEDGVILPETVVSFEDGDSAFDVLEKVCRSQRIHLEFEESPMYGSIYIEGIGNIYEFDCGSLSGWMYSVNDEFPMFGSSEYVLKDGDRIVFAYTCDMGTDVGNASVGADGYE